jgi:hypothetical protein
MVGERKDVSTINVCRLFWVIVNVLGIACNRTLFIDFPAPLRSFGCL